MRPLIELFHSYEMEVIDVERSDIYGGSIRVYAANRDEHPVAPSVAHLVAEEERAGLYADETNQKFAQDVAARRERLFDTVYKLYRDGAKIVGIGAPAKASTVANYCRLGPDLIEYITEVNPLRTNMYLPGTHVPIVDEERMFTDDRPPDAAILFAWNYYDEIVPKLRDRGYEGDLIEP